MAKAPPPPRPKRKPKRPRKPKPSMGDPYARALAGHVRDGHGVGAAATMDVCDEMGSPRGYVGTRNIALDRALGTPGIPLGRMTEISGWPGAGKSTMLDQIIAQCQAEGGIGVLADVERARNRGYMARLGINFESLIWIDGSTVETMFDEIETLARNVAHYRAEAWRNALVRSGTKCPKCPTYRFEVFDPATHRQKNRKPIKVFVLSRWGREQAAAILEYQKAHNLPQTSVRDAPVRKLLRPVIVHTDDPVEMKKALAAWDAGEEHDLVQSADRPIIVGWDSVAGTPTEGELDGDARDIHPASAARVIRRNLRRLVQLIDDEQIGFVLINQRYEKLQMGNRSGYKASETYGGGGIKYHTTIRIEVDKVGDIFESTAAKTNKEPPLGQIVRIKVPKNKIESPFRTEEYGLVFGRGAENAFAMYQDFKARGIIRVGGAWSRFVDPSILGTSDKSFRGWMGLSNMMADDPVLWATLKALFMEGR
jgi:RecA/RadA recombinase